MFLVCARRPCRELLQTLVVWFGSCTPVVLRQQVGGPAQVVDVWRTSYRMRLGGRARWRVVNSAPILVASDIVCHRLKCSEQRSTVLRTRPPVDLAPSAPYGG
jgi:hypothetical protein